MTDILIIYKIIVIIYKITVIWLDPELVGSEPYWSDPDPINCPDPKIESHKTRQKCNKLDIFLHLYNHLLPIYFTGPINNIFLYLLYSSLYLYKL